MPAPGMWAVERKTRTSVGYYGCYKITNTVTGDFYIGKAMCLRSRRRLHFGQLARGGHCNRLLQESWNTHGAEAFSFSFLNPDMSREAVLIEALHPAFNMGVAPATDRTGSNPTSLSESVKSAIRHELTDRQWSLLELSNRSGVSYSRVHQWLNGNPATDRKPHSITLDTMGKLMDTLDIVFSSY